MTNAQQYASIAGKAAANSNSVSCDTNIRRKVYLFPWGMQIYTTHI